MPMLHQKIAYVIGARFPTSKAYGITARETLEVLNNNGYIVKVFCSKSDYYDKDFKNIEHITENFPKSHIANMLTKFGEMNSSRLNFIIWNLGLILKIIKSAGSICDFDPNLIWVRDPMIALLYLQRNKTYNFIIEVHDQSGVFFYKRLIKYKDKIKFCPINVRNENFIHEICPQFRSQLAPMGIRKENLENHKTCLSFIDSLESRKHKGIKIAYIGKFAPGNYSKGIEDLIELAKLYSDNNEKFYVTLIGANEEELRVYNNLKNSLHIKDKYLKIRRHTRHSKVIKAMHKYDVLVLPEYRSQEYSGMPIKLLEYLSSGKITVVANTDLYRSLFTSEYKPFFYISGDKYSLDHAIKISLNDKELEKKLIGGIDFASKFTWEKRTLEIIN